jgi:hypothetical protein
MHPVLSFFLPFLNHSIDIYIFSAVGLTIQMYTSVVEFIIVLACVYNEFEHV